MSSCATCSKPNAASVCGRCKCTYYCNIECQRKDWKQHKKICKTLILRNNTNTDTKSKNKTNIKRNDEEKANIPLFRIAKVKGKGLGMIANEDISIGTMILKEDPLLSLISDVSFNIRTITLDQFTKEYAKPLIQRFKALTTTQQETICALSYKHDGSLLDIFLNNCLTHKDNGFDGVYPTVARLNHSCDANCLHWIQAHDNNYNARIIALKNIKKGEELTINYMGWNPFLFKERANVLLDGWKIEKCGCEWCHKKMRKQRDQWIGEYKQLDDAIPQIKDFNRKYESCKRIVELIQDKFNSNPQLLYRHCWDLAQCSLCVIKGDEFVTNLVKTVKYKRLAHGRDTKVPEEVEEMINQMPPDIQKEIRSKIKKSSK